jgi:hypothetical protein
MKFAFKSAALCAALVVGSMAHATNYEYTEHFSYVGRPALSNAEGDARLQSDTEACDNAVGEQNGAPTAAYRSCMLQRGWKYTNLTRKRLPDDPNFSSSAKVAPGHFIDHDNGMDCYNSGGAEICDPPNGTVHYFDPDQGLPCTRTGAASICTNF